MYGCLLCPLAFNSGFFWLPLIWTDNQLSIGGHALIICQAGHARLAIIKTSKDTRRYGIAQALLTSLLHSVITLYIPDIAYIGLSPSYLAPGEQPRLEPYHMNLSKARCTYLPAVASCLAPFGGWLHSQ